MEPQWQIYWGDEMWQKRSICYFHELEDQIDVNLVDNGFTSVAFDWELCKGQGTWGIPIMVLAYWLGS